MRANWTIEEVARFTGLSEATVWNYAWWLSDAETDLCYPGEDGRLLYDVEFVVLMLAVAALHDAGEYHGIPLELDGWTTAELLDCWLADMTPAEVARLNADRGWHQHHVIRYWQSLGLDKLDLREVKERIEIWKRN